MKWNDNYDDGNDASKSEKNINRLPAEFQQGRPNAFE